MQHVLSAASVSMKMRFRMTFPLRWDETGRITMAFSPDFYLPDEDLYVELTTMRQRLVTHKNRKLRLLSELYPGVKCKLIYRRDVANLAIKYGLFDDPDADSTIYNPRTLNWDADSPRCLDLLIDKIMPCVQYFAYVEITPFDLVKYEIDKVTGYLRVDRPQRTSSQPPTIYGFIPRTYCGRRVHRLSPDAAHGDGDPLDICVITERPLNRAEVILTARVVGGIQASDG